MRSRVEALLNQAPRGERAATSFKVDRKLYDGLRAVCDSRGITTSDMVEALIEELLARVQQPVAVPAKRGRPAAIMTAK